MFFLFIIQIGGALTVFRSLVVSPHLGECLPLIGQAHLHCLTRGCICFTAAGSMERRRLGDSDKEDAIVMDASFRHHWPKFILW